MPHVYTLAHEMLVSFTDCYFSIFFSFFFFFNDTATTEIYTLSLHDALPISVRASLRSSQDISTLLVIDAQLKGMTRAIRDRKSTRLNSSHGYISYAVFCLKKKKKKYNDKDMWLHEQVDSTICARTSVHQYDG